MPDAGSISGNAYRNEFFGFTYQFPKGWLVKQAGNGPQATQSPGKPGVYVLLFAFQPRNLFELSTILVRAVKLSSPDLTAERFLLDEYQALKNSGFKPEGEPKELSAGGWQFASLISREKVGGGTLRQENLVAIQKGYALEFNFIANQEGTFKLLHKTIETLTAFNPATACGGRTQGFEATGRTGSAPQADSGVTKETIESTGTISGNVYKNGFFELSYQFPSGMRAEGQAGVEHVVRAGHEAIYGNKPEEDVEHQAAERQTIRLLTVVGPRPEVPSAPDQMVLLAEDVSAFPSTNAKRCMMELAFALSHNPLRFQQYRLPGEKRVGKLKFAKAEFKAQVNHQGQQITIYTTYLGIVLKGYFVAWGFSAGSEKALKPLVASIDSVTLRSATE
ncbi:MAG TPA: hypothetical protein VGW33_01685 [Terriglobia bacterium]|nr:hypothetical protein [Terriglobia bacterium]